MNGSTALLRFLVRSGVLTNDAARSAEAAVAKTANARSVIDWLVSRGITTEEELAQLLAEGVRVPFVNLPTVALDPAVTSLVREELAGEYQIVPLRVHAQGLVVATANPLDRAALHAVEFATGKRVHVEVATQTAVRDALQHAYHLDETLNAYLRAVPNDGEVPVAELKDEAAVDLRGLVRESALPPVVKLFNLILLEGLRTHASDVHIEANLSAVRVRYRIDGVLEESLRLPKWIQDPLIARCKVLAKLDISERQVPQDGRMQLRYRDTTVDLRASSLPTQFGEKVTLRVLDPSGAPHNLNGLALSERDLKCVRRAIARPEGLILVTGPTGSGKTTTLYGMIAEIVSPTRNIVTVENPLEYQVGGINQVEVNEKQGMTFATTLRSILRQDPDVIMVGEVRDAETAEVAAHASQTGHLVLGTLHANDTVGAVARLSDLGIEPYLLASSLQLIVAQRLLRRVCATCATPYVPDADALRALRIEPANQPFRRGRGCSACRKSGYSGRIGVFEVLSVTPALAKLIEAKAAESTLRAQAREDGTTLLIEHAAARVCAGLTTPEEVLRVIHVAAAAPRCPECDHVVDDGFSVCPHCGAALQCACASCGMRLQKDWQVCPYCGTPTKQVPQAAPHPAGAGTPASLRQYRALVVDDHADMRRLIAFTLEHSGLPIVTVQAANGRQALERVSDAPPDLIVLDVMMPEMDGLEVCTQLRANVRTAFIPILMLTARDDPDSRAMGFLAGTDDYVGKPFARAELLARVRRLLERTYGTMLPPLAIEASPADNGRSAAVH